MKMHCNLLITELNLNCTFVLTMKQSSPKQLAECVDLLLQLHEPADQLCEEFLSQYVMSLFLLTNLLVTLMFYITTYLHMMRVNPFKFIKEKSVLRKILWQDSQEIMLNPRPVG